MVDGLGLSILSLSGIGLGVHGLGVLVSLRNLGLLRLCGSSLGVLRVGGTENRVVIVVVLVLGLGDRGFARFGGRGGERGGTGHGSAGNGEARRSALALDLLGSLFLGGFLGGLSLSCGGLGLNLRGIAGLGCLSLGCFNLGCFSLVSFGCLSRLSGSHNRGLLAGGGFEQEALVGGLPIYGTQVGGVHLQALTQARVQGHSRAVPGRAGFLGLGVQGCDGRKPVNAGQHDAVLDLATAVQQAVVHVLIHLAQLQAQGSRTAGAHELSQRVEGALLAEDGEVRGTLCGGGEHNGFGHKLGVIGAQLLLGGGGFVGSRLGCGVLGVLLCLVLSDLELLLGLVRRLGRLGGRLGKLLYRNRLAHKYLRRRFGLFA